MSARSVTYRLYMEYVDKSDRYYVGSFARHIEAEARGRAIRYPGYHHVIERVSVPV